MIELLLAGVVGALGYMGLSWLHTEWRDRQDRRAFIAFLKEFNGEIELVNRLLEEDVVAIEAPVPDERRLH